MGRFKRVLFFAEAVTLAHVARPVALAKSLDPANYEITIACDPRYQQFLECEPWQNCSLHSISSQKFLQALATGSRVYDVRTLRAYVEEDLKLIEQFKPDVIVGDFRLSLSVSARLVGIPYITIANAYWSPYYLGNFPPLPVLPLTKILPLPVAGMLFRLAQPLAFGLHCRPLNRVRQENQLPSLGTDLRRIYTDADFTLYADIPEMFPTADLPPNHYYLGPILWSPPGAKPNWWDDLPAEKPIIYLTLGSSGHARLLPIVLEALADLPVTVIAATAGATLRQPIPANVYVADYLPGTEAAVRARLVICNGGSLTCQQAFAAGVPVLGIASNMDQFLNMKGVTDAGAGILLRADRLTSMRIRTIAKKMLIDAPYTENAMKLASAIARTPSPKRFAAFMDALVSGPGLIAPVQGCDLQP